MVCSWVLMNRILIKSGLRDIVPRCQRRQRHPTPVLLLGKSHGWRSLVGCSPWGCEELDTTEWLHFHFSLSCTGEGNGNPLLCSCLENPSDGGAWWAAVYGVAQSRTRLKRQQQQQYPNAIGKRRQRQNIMYEIYHECINVGQKQLRKVNKDFKVKSPWSGALALPQSMIRMLEREIMSSV